MIEIKKVWFNKVEGNKNTVVQFEYNDGLKVFTNTLEVRGHIEDREKLIKIIDKIGPKYGKNK